MYITSNKRGLQGTERVVQTYLRKTGAIPPRQISDKRTCDAIDAPADGCAAIAAARPYLTWSSRRTQRDRHADRHDTTCNVARANLADAQRNIRCR